MSKRHIVIFVLFSLPVVLAMEFGWEYFLHSGGMGADRAIFSLNGKMALIDVLEHALPAFLVVVVFSFALFKVVSDLKKIESEKDKGAALYKAVFSNAASGIVLMNLDRRYIQVNDVWCTMTGYSHEEMMGLTNKNLTHAEDLEKTTAAREKIINGEKDQVRLEKRYIKKNGDIMWGDLGITPIREEDKIIALLGVIHDITHKKEIEETLKKSEGRHRDFSVDVAHELRTPLSILRINVHALKDGGDVEELCEDIDRMTRTVEQLLIRARLDELTIGPLACADIQGLSTQVAAQMAPFALKEGRIIEVIGAEAPVMVHGDENSLELALRNLIENAVKYSARNSTVTIEVTDAPLIRVIDRGWGIPIEQRDAVFARFARSDRRSTGSGIGLSIVQRTVEAHDGSIEISDTPGGGSTFTIYLNGA